MSVIDEEIELLEAYIDGDLPEAVAAALRHRLLAEPALASSLDELLVERGVRTQLFESLEPEDATVERFISRIQKEISKDIVWGERLRILRYIGTAAACVVFSFFAGWVGRSHLSTPAATSGSLSGSSLVQTNDGNTGGTASFGGNTGLGTLVSNTLPRDSGIRFPGVNPVGSNQTGAYQVALTDNLGHIIAVQRFNTLEEAREFSQDVARWQKQQQQIRGADTVLIKDEF